MSPMLLKPKPREGTETGALRISRTGSGDVLLKPKPREGTETRYQTRRYPGQEIRPCC